MFKRFRLVGVALFVIAASLALLTHPAAATQNFNGLCDVTSDPQTVQANSDVTFQFNFTNTDPNDTIDWVTITTPSTSFTIESQSASGWTGFTDATGAEFNGGTMGNNDNATFDVEVNSGDFQPGEMNWGFYAYTNSDVNGPGNQVCQNVTALTMIDNNPYVSDVTPNDVTPDSVTINWTTTLASTSQINYGLDDTYGSSTNLDNSLLTDHSQTITGLAPNTVYHYQVESTTPSGGEDMSDDNTFVTPELAGPAYSGSSTPSSSSNSSAASTLPLGISITDKNETSAPKISFSGLPSHLVYKTAPTLSGQATDSVMIQRVEYSTDNGQNWLPVNTISGVDTPSVNFSFTPVNLPDGSYQVLARAVNAGGVVTRTSPITVVVEGLMPIVGGNMISLGPQVLTPDNHGAITSLAGIDQTISLGTVGGPKTVTLVAVPIGTRIQSQAFGLTLSPSTQLWSGDVNITKPGHYNLISTAIDGGNLQSTQNIETLNIMADPHTYNLRTKKPLKTTVTAYYKAPDSGEWVVWDGSSFGESNPQITPANGSFKLFLPPGTYYLKVTAPDYEPLITDIFSLSSSQPLTTSFGLSPDLSVPFGLFHLTLPSVATRYVSLNAANPSATSIQATSIYSLVGKPLPSFHLAETNGQNLTPTQLLGKPTLLVLCATWAPESQNQFSILDKLQSNNALNIVPVALQQNAGEVEAYSSIAGLNLTWLVDPSSTLSPTIGSPFLPTDVFVDRNGIVRDVAAGPLTEAQIEQKLNNL